jgi:hypothetical protein
MRLIKSMRLNKSVRNQWSRVQKTMREKPAMSAGAISLGVIALLAAAMFATREPAATDAQIDRNISKKAMARATSGDAAAAQAPAVDDVKASAPKPAPVTITGCLERNDETFRLKDTSGADAPKSRSWKSGFLKKGTKPIDVVDASKRLKLGDHVGQRVSVTGTLVDREMQVRSLKRVAPSCS